MRDYVAERRVVSLSNNAATTFVHFATSSYTSRHNDWSWVSLVMATCKVLLRWILNEVEVLSALTVTRLDACCVWKLNDVYKRLDASPS